MRLAELVAGVHAEFDVPAALADVAEVAGHDRYQASAGIVAAAAAVAERASAAGLADVTVHRFPADGARHWWSFRAPLAWTPVRARLDLDGTPVVRYPEQPYTLAAYSAPSPPGGVPARLVRWSAVRAGADPAGAVVVLDDPAVPLPAAVEPLAAGRAVAIAADPLWTRADREADQVGRLELPPGAPLAAFSLTRSGLARLLAGADAAATATVDVQIDPAAVEMPVVTGLLPGSGPGEILVTAHLCHPRPSANDNASGVATLLGAARLLAAHVTVGGPAIRFLWGPEFVGVAGYLHDLVHCGSRPRPVLGVNVDMAGQDPYRCGGPLVVERGPDDLPSFLPALSARCAELLPPASRSYSGAVPCDTWTWRETPFAGGSDHALPVDEPTRCPTVGFGHWPDRTNHSSADTMSTVDPVELRRTGTVVTSVLAALRHAADPLLSADLVAATAAWAAGHVLGALPGRQPPAAPPRWTDGEPVLDPRADGVAARRVAHRGAVALGAVHALSLAGVPADRVAAAADRAAATIHAIATTVDAPDSEPAPGQDDRTVLARCWPGPVNVRALAEAAPPGDRAWLTGQLAEDRGGNLARTAAILRAIDGARDRRAVAWWAALASELPVPVAFADRLLDLLCRAGWAAAPPAPTEVADAVARPA